MSPSTRTVPVPVQYPETLSQTELEPRYRVIIHNDDVTPMDFVVYILKQIFFVTGPAAVEIMFEAHYMGSAYVQTLPKNEAQARIARAQFASGIEGYPLHFTMEPE
jgi:ATP-dependent Clp protease adaptor protein ClpS